MAPRTAASDSSVSTLAGNRNGGYTYFGILFVVTLIGLALTGASLVIQVERQREKEQLLLFIGQQYANAIASYYNDAPGGNKRYPRSIAELLRDPRFPTIKRHLRRPWPDPFTHSKEWGIVHTKQGGIAGIYSLGTGKPFKQAGFASPIWDKLLSNKSRYQDWKFVYIASMSETVAAKESGKENDHDGTEQSGLKAISQFGNMSASGQEGAAENTEEEETGAELLPPEAGATESGSVPPAEDNQQNSPQNNQQDN